MRLSLKQAAAKALADLQLMPGWEQLDEKLQLMDPFGTNTDVILTNIEQTLERQSQRPLEVMTVQVDEHCERHPYMVRALLYLLNDRKIPAAIWPRESNGRTMAALVVY